MPRGRPPKPTAQKILEGNPGKRALNMDEPTPPPSDRTPPAYLDGDALAKWTEMAAELSALGLLTRVDEDQLSFYCVQFGRWKHAEAMVKLKGEIIKTEGGNLIQNPFLSVANRALKEMGRIASEFGLTPASRARLHTPTKDTESDLEKSLFGDVVKVGK